MPRLSGSADPETSPLGKFAWELRSLRDRMGATAPTVDEISAREAIPRSTLYAALTGHRLPRRDVVAALARHWGSDETVWLEKRSELERRLGSTTHAPEHGDPTFSTKNIDALRTVGTRRLYQAGDVLFIEGDESRHVLLIEDGVVKVIATAPSGSPTVLALRGPGELIGEMSAVDGEPRSASAVAATPLTVTMVDGSTFAGLLHRNPDMALELTRSISRRLQSATRRRLESEMGAADRVLSFLLMISEQHGTPQPDGSLKVPMYLSQQEMASTVGISRASLARALRHLRESGTVSIGRQVILIHPQS